MTEQNSNEKQNSDPLETALRKIKTTAKKNPLVTGAIVGFGVAGPFGAAAGAALGNKETRDALKSAGTQLVKGANEAWQNRHTNNGPKQK